MHKNSNKF